MAYCRGNKTLQSEIDFGFIRIGQTYDNTLNSEGPRARNLMCKKRGCKYTKNRIMRHIAYLHRDLGETSGLSCPRRPETFPTTSLKCTYMGNMYKTKRPK